jgi:hypothetical protein
MCVGYTDNHSRVVYLMLNLEYLGVIDSRDAICLNKIFKDWVIEKLTIHKTVEDDDNDLPLVKNPNFIMINGPPSDQDK